MPRGVGTRPRSARAAWRRAGVAVSGDREGTQAAGRSLEAFQRGRRRGECRCSGKGGFGAVRQRLRQSREKPTAAPRGWPVVSAQATCLQLVASSKQLWPVLKVHRIEGTRSTPRRLYDCMASCRKSVQVLGAFFVSATADPIVMAHKLCQAGTRESSNQRMPVGDHCLNRSAAGGSQMHQGLQE